MRNDSPPMLQARKIVEDHIAAYGWVPHPDKIKEAIARALLKATAPAVTYSGGGETDKKAG